MINYIRLEADRRYYARLNIQHMIDSQRARDDADRQEAIDRAEAIREDIETYGLIDPETGQRLL